MNPKDALSYLVDKSGANKQRLSRAIGKHENFVSTTLYKQSVPRLDTFTALADAMGYEVIIRGNGEEITLDAPSAE